MDTLNITVLTNRTAEIVDFMPFLMGRHVRLSNGCSLHLTKHDVEEQRYAGTNPYGMDAYFDSIDSIKDWLDFWDAPRDEYGILTSLSVI
jgi:hypothetical protein